MSQLVGFNMDIHRWAKLKLEGLVMAGVATKFARCLWFGRAVT
jgi:hypothetical protein